MRVEIECNCGKTIEPDLNDIVIDSEDYTPQKVICPDCGAKYRVQVSMTIES